MDLLYVKGIVLKHGTDCSVKKINWTDCNSEKSSITVCEGEAMDWKKDFEGKSTEQCIGHGVSVRDIDQSSEGSCA